MKLLLACLPGLLLGADAERVAVETHKGVPGEWVPAPVARGPIKDRPRDHALALPASWLHFLAPKTRYLLRKYAHGIACCANALDQNCWVCVCTCRGCLGRRATTHTRTWVFANACQATP